MFRFDNFSVDDAALAIYRAVEVFNNKKVFQDFRKKIMAVDFSWEKSAKDYIEIYKELI